MDRFAEISSFLGVPPGGVRVTELSLDSRRVDVAAILLKSNSSVTCYHRRQNTVLRDGGLDEPCQGPRPQTSSGGRGIWHRKPCGQTEKQARILVAEPLANIEWPQGRSGLRMTAQVVEKASVGGAVSGNCLGKATCQRHIFSRVLINFSSYLEPVDSVVGAQLLVYDVVSLQVAFGSNCSRWNWIAACCRCCLGHPPITIAQSAATNGNGPFL